MNMRNFGVLLALGVSSALCAACDTVAPQPEPVVALPALAERLEEVVCPLALECVCTSGRAFLSPVECSLWAQDTQAVAEEAIRVGGLRWDSACAGAFVQTFESLGCGTREPWPSEPGCIVPCAPVHGSRAADEPCAWFGDYTNCAQGLVCSGDVCIDPCADTGGSGNMGELAAVAEPCMGHAECETGYCPAAFCAELPELGGDCRGTGVCAQGLHCREDVCASNLSPGAACEVGDCGGGLGCIDGACTEDNFAACWPQQYLR